MGGQTTFPRSIATLVERFREHRTEYRQGKYKETQLRREYLDPLFKALGWDVDNTSGHAEAYKDVIHEDAIKIGGATKAPDYAFRIGGVRKFFVEAKKPSVDIKGDPHPAYQLRRYAWSAKLSLSILTDFEEFAVYDCAVKPHESDGAAAARTIYLTFDQYEERWEEIASIFSKDAILKGSFDRYAASKKKKRGTAEVDKEFLAEIETWRDLLARNVANRNPDLDQRELNFAVQRTIDRIIFLRICEDRGIEDYGTLQGLLNGANIYQRLFERFQRADERYNSGLFHFSAERDRPGAPDELSAQLAIDDDVLKKILRRMYYPASPYEFSVLPADVLGQVYEQFLGKVIRLTPGHRAKVEDKPEVRKAGGVYYTPTYIVDYIVQHTVGRLLEGKTPQEVAGLTDNWDPSKRRHPLTVLDPACGSGSFLLGAYQCLLNWYLQEYLDDGPENHTQGREPRLVQLGDNDWRLTTSERKRILLSHIYGVDIDRQAVEVTKLSLLLKVLEGENRDTLAAQRRLFHERALPDLGNNIKCGNSLIGCDFYDHGTLFDDDTAYRVNAFDWEAEFPQIFERGGFDAVIGNPPYGATLGSEETHYLRANYTCQSYQLDSYLLFLERAVSTLVGQHGKCSYIIPNPWLTNLRQQATRRFVLTAARIGQIVHIYFPVFKNAVVDTQIVVLERPFRRESSVQVVFAHDVTADGHLATELGPTHEQNEWVALDGGVINIFLTPKEKSLFARIGQMSRPLDDWFKINVGIKPYQTGKGTPPQTKEQVRSRPFDSSVCVDASYRELLRGKDVERYSIRLKEARYIKYGPWLAEPRPSADFDANVKLLVRQTGDRPIAMIETAQRLAMNNLHVLVPFSDEGEGVQFILGVLNSRLLTWYYRCMNPEAGEALAEVKRQNVAALPIRPIDFDRMSDQARHDRLESLVGAMIDLQKRFTAARTNDDRTRLKRHIAATDRKIDRLVYELYELTEDEIAIIENATI